MTKTEIKVPVLGESVSEATVAQWLKKEGDTVAMDEPIVELETDKVTLEVNAPKAGVISKIIAAEGTNVGVGAILGEIGAANDSGQKQIKSEEKPLKRQEPEKEEKTSGAEEKLSPAVRKMVEEHNIDPSKIKGTGKEGRLIKEDIQNFIEQHGKYAESPPTEAVSTHPIREQKEEPRATEEREQRVRMTRLRQRIAQRLKEAQNTAAILTTFNEVDMGAIMDLRNAYKDVFEKKHGVKLGFMSFFTKAAINALKEIPAVNAEIDGDDIIYKNYYDIGMAVSTPQGLVVPVIRDCDTKSMAQIEKDIMEMGVKARDGKIELEDMTGGTFTITNGGVFGSLVSTPILNAPQSGILGMHKIQQRPMVMPDGSIAARPMMYLALSYDHRVIDGRDAVTFLVRIKEALEDPQRLLLDI
ncbi:MAG: dihydrolipoyllysine-residue succinyltransferase [Alphaproteobacteria bacterium CG_4_9_14_3_um_filter_47_13]|nr:MAG: dihydrolipoyllysine-residue succinyltransferase [Alphaproteobacteria bacterium CG_4_9_14_3_um_filter_47_13]